MKVFFVDDSSSPLADHRSELLMRTRNALLSAGVVSEVTTPRQADVILIQEKGAYKDFRYISKLMRDPITGAYADRVFTINNDDCATGLLRGLYTSLPRSRFDVTRHSVVPFMTYPNERVLSGPLDAPVPEFLAAWRGNTKSNRLRRKMLAIFGEEKDFVLQTTDSWLNHLPEEKSTYVDLIGNARFSLCPAGWAAVTYRIYESMALARCPVILADEFVPPPGPNWSQCAIFYPEKKLEQLQAFLRDRAESYESIGLKAYSEWRTFFSPDVVVQYYAKALLTLLKRSGRSTRAVEFRKWRSGEMYWTNGWTLPQRVMNKVSKWKRVLE